MNTRPNIVLIHGAWANGSAWGAVIQRLQADDYHVTAPQLPMSSLDEDVARVRQVLAAQSGPTLLVGHSFGGAVVTQLGDDAPNVVGLVDQVLPPAAQHLFAQRMGANTTSVAGSHASMVSHPDEVTAFIEQAAQAVSTSARAAAA